MAKRAAPEVNAGSMADIAFLLLIFFLVTTTIESDTGMNRKLPPKFDDRIKPPIIKQKNLFTVVVSKDNQLLVEEEPLELKDLREATIAFLDNNGDGKCAYCKGKKLEELSAHPNKAVISVQNSRETNYASYIAIQNELIAAYNFLRNREAQRLFGESYLSINQKWKDAEDGSPEKEEFEKKRDEIKKLYPEKISESEAKE